MAESGVRELVSIFLGAFENLDWPRFRDCWSAEPVAIYPSLVPEESGRRVDTLPGFERAWQRQFDRIRESSGASTPPYHRIDARDLRIDFISPEVAVVTFHLGPDNGVLGRRLLVVKNGPGGWKITHLHASNLTLVVH